MTKTHSVKLHIDRELSIPLHGHDIGQIIYAIVYGELGSGTPLLCIREIASLLKVSMMTVYSVYREMVSDWLLVNQPRVGYFLAQPIPSKKASTVVILKEIYVGSCITASGRLCF